MKTLYEELRDLAIKDNVVYTYLRTQEATGASDRDTLLALVRELVRQKDFYMQDAIDTRNRSVVPILLPSQEAE